MKSHLLKRNLFALAAASVCFGSWAAGPETQPANPTYTEATKATANEQDMLERRLQVVGARADYAKVIESNGYRISAINSDKPEYLEYEVVKGKNTYEVQLDFDKGATKASKIDVTSNLWRADSTKQMMENANYKHAAPLVADADARYSDRRYKKAWSDEKERLEHALPANQPVATYKTMLEQQGYQVTAVNKNKADYVEYEIVKGDNSYEVQIDLDAKTKLGKKVDVTSNVWEAEGTEHAKAANQAVQKQ